MWSAEGQKKSYGLDAGDGFEWKNRSVGYGKQRVLVWPCIEGKMAYIFGRVLELKVIGQIKKGRPKWTWNLSGCRRKCEGWFEKGRCSLPIKVVCQLG